MPQATRKDIPSYEHDKGRFLLMDPEAVPSWVKPATRDDPKGELPRKLAKAGAICCEKYGDGQEGLDVWRLGDDSEYLITRWDGNQHVCNIICRDMADYLALQPWISALAVKIMAADAAWRLSEAA